MAEFVITLPDSLAQQIQTHLGDYTVSEIIQAAVTDWLLLQPRGPYASHARVAALRQKVLRHDFMNEP